MAMVNKEKDGLNPGRKDFKGEVNGIMIGYQGHVPRARDKVGGSPLGNLPGTPVSPNGKVGIDMEAMMNGQYNISLPEGREKTFAQFPIQGDYTPEARDEFLRQFTALGEYFTPGMLDGWTIEAINDNGRGHFISPDEKQRYRDVKTLAKFWIR